MASAEIGAAKTSSISPGFGRAAKEDGIAPTQGTMRKPLGVPTSSSSPRRSTALRRQADLLLALAQGGAPEVLAGLAAAAREGDLAAVVRQRARARA